MRLSIILICFWLASAAQAAEVHIVHCLKGCPTGAPASNDFIVRQIYALSTNDSTKFADWAAYLVTRETSATSKDLNRGWQADPFLDDDETLEPDDYKKAHNQINVDRGHLVPLASFAGTIFWRDTNFLSNITPQRSDLNQGAWVNLESAIRVLAHEQGEAYVLTGPLYESDESPLPEANETHRVPSGFWKVVANKSGKISAFIFDQELDRNANYCAQRKPLSDVETRSGLNLFPEAASDWMAGNLDTELGCN